METTNATADVRIPHITFVISCIVYPSIMLISLIGNCLVIAVVARNASMRTITNLFIANLSLSDLIMTILPIPVTPLGIFVPDFNLPNGLCQLVPVLMIVSVLVSSLTFMAIAIDRYLVIVHPFVKRMSLRVYTLLIALIWLTSGLISIPSALSYSIHTNDTTNQTACGPAGQPVFSQSAYQTALTGIQFLAPFITSCFCYYRISRILKRRCEQKIGCGQSSRTREEQDLTRKRRTNKMVIVMISIFVICWTPLNILWLWCDFSGGSVSENTLLYLHMIAMTSSIYNPILYAWYNHQFRSEFLLLVTCRPPGASNVTGTQGTTKFRWSIIGNHNHQRLSIFRSSNHRRLSSQVKDDPTSQSTNQCPSDARKGHEQGVDLDQKPKEKIGTIPDVSRRPRLTIADGDGGIWHGPSFDIEGDQKPENAVNLSAM